MDRPIRSLLARAGADRSHVMLRATDGYYEEFPLEALEDGFLADGMNGRILPRRHGYPVRAHVPGHWGEINVKWLTEIEVLEREAIGYWGKRGWHGTGPVNTVAKLHAVNRLSDADAGRWPRLCRNPGNPDSRSLDRWWKQLERGDPEPPLSGADVWRQWKHEWRPSINTSVVVVRAVDGLGNRQPREGSQPYPSGATGWVSKILRP